ncbi:hypothetical protein PMI42_06904 [Bradyrhizobium sp. YR681]|uniref:hypothetical protein n=1 Tax=Bradyrhizobium sp. YR681 TaxID=1144344 RepID=UPI00026F97E3|nr:hypothetical protein [Bradyrhizobium sp. YR681]EJN09147.1 hypothetical protein PMI42_06904 [Bradyrhizobium sp. YR681]
MTGTQAEPTTGPTDAAPRRYFVDAGGRRVLIGLTPEETFEFERLDSGQAPGGAQAAPDGRVVWPDAGERRRLELYEKHDGAWRAWMAQSRTERRDGFNLY